MKEVRKIKNKDRVKQTSTFSEWFRWILEKIGAVSTGHFVFKDGAHSGVKVLSRILTGNPHELQIAADAIAKASLIEDKNPSIDTVVSPVAGAVSLGNRVAESIHYTVRFAMAERIDGKMGFNPDSLAFVRGRRILIVEDTTTTGSTVWEVIEAIREVEGIVVGIGLIWNRGMVVFGDIPTYSCITDLLPDYPEDNCPLCRKGVVIYSDKHGREFLKKYGRNKRNWPANKKKEKV